MTEPRWADVVRHAEEEIRRLHASLETIQPEATTNQLRGEIRALRRLLALGEEKAPTPPEKMVQPPDSHRFV